jgi:ATP-dependent Clp protease ATP-binding subunit ClpA
MITLKPEVVRILNAAQWEAARMGKQEADSGHLLLGLFYPPQTQAVRVLASLGVQPKQERLCVVTETTDDVWPPAVPVPVLPRCLAPECDHVLRLAQQEAEAQGAASVGAAHLVIGLLREKCGLGAMLLYAYGLTVGKVAPLLYRAGASD